MDSAPATPTRPSISLDKQREQRARELHEARRQKYRVRGKLLRWEACQERRQRKAQAAQEAMEARQQQLDASIASLRAAVDSLRVFDTVLADMRERVSNLS
jgi:hypothetical protein